MLVFVAGKSVTRLFHPISVEFYPEFVKEKEIITALCRYSLG